MKASTGDRIIIKSHHGGEPDRDCEVLAADGADGGPPFRVRWGDTGREVIFFPGADARLQHFVHGRSGGTDGAPHEDLRAC